MILKLEPITDPHLQVEWFKDGTPVIIGHRFRPLHDFGYVALDIMDTISDDSGVYTCRATNLAGTCEIQARLICHSKQIILLVTLRQNSHFFQIPQNSHFKTILFLVLNSHIFLKFPFFQKFILFVTLWQNSHYF